MALKIEDYALIGDLCSAALVGRDGSIDWLCWPRFDSDACFAALLGTSSDGRWQIQPTHPVKSARRQYRGDTLVLENEIEVEGGVVRIVDCMPPRARTPELVRVVEGISGEVEISVRLAVRFGYGHRKPWIQRDGDTVTLTSAPDALVFRPGRPVTIDGADVLATFIVRAGERIPFTLAWHLAHESCPAPSDPFAAVKHTTAFWEDWTSRCAYRGQWRDPVVRSLITLKALTYAPTGGIVAAVTTSLPEKLGGVRNWDYRYCWLRDATLTLYSLINAGYTAEATAFAGWLQRAARGEPSRLQIMYGVAGEHRLTEIEVPWLEGYEKSRPVRIGNAASEQLQLDTYGELIDCFHNVRLHGVGPEPDLWQLEKALVGHLQTVWDQPDRGIWESRGKNQQFTYSKVMVWAALDRMIKDGEMSGLDGPIDQWKSLRERVHADVCAHGYDSTRNTFTQAYGSSELDASLLLIPQVGFLPPKDPRVVGTIDAIRADLLRGGFVHRYDTRQGSDGLPPGEGVFLPCSFWFADALFLIGKHDEAHEYFEHLLALRNDVGLLSEEYEPTSSRMVGNFPQAFTHVALVNTAINLSGSPGPATRRAGLV